MRRRVPVALAVAAALVLASALGPSWFQAYRAEAQSVPVLRWGSTGQAVSTLQWRLQQWGYYHGRIDGVYGAETYRAVVNFQRKNGVWPADGVVGEKTWRALGLYHAVAGTAAPAVPAGTSAAARSDELELLARVVAAEAQGEPFEGQVAVAAVILNRVRDPRFPNTLSGVIYQPHAFESVTNGLIWRRTPTDEAYRAARAALNGWDPTYGAIFFWNPSKPVSPWIWTRQIVARIGNHVFAV
ncbi:MAG: spore cortex-lytic enzyme [Limnochordia bacterium]|nr:spore cortex-lytic enzyme [Bacillota bacterium]